eukprot:1158951-Pleurochrysis_carterae.AAC.1
MYRTRDVPHSRSTHVPHSTYRTRATRHFTPVPLGRPAGVRLRHSRIRFDVCRHFRRTFSGNIRTGGCVCARGASGSGVCCSAYGSPLRARESARCRSRRGASILRRPPVAHRNCARCTLRAGGAARKKGARKKGARKRARASAAELGPLWCLCPPSSTCLLAPSLPPPAPSSCSTPRSSSTPLSSPSSLSPPAPLNLFHPLFPPHSSSPSRPLSFRVHGCRVLPPSLILLPARPARVSSAPSCVRSSVREPCGRAGKPRVHSGGQLGDRPTYLLALDASIDHCRLLPLFTFYCVILHGQVHIRLSIGKANTIPCTCAYP